MAAKKKPKEDAAALAADEGAVTPRLSLSEKGYTGLKTINGRIYEETNRALAFPCFFRTIEEMRRTAIISSALSAYKFLFSTVQWNVVPPIGASEEEIKRAKFIESVKDDMDMGWDEFISDVFEYIPYGHSVQEKVYRRRLRKNGSRYNDGLVGLRRLAPRAQETLYKWEFSEDGRELVAVLQSLDRMENGHLFITEANEEGLIRIPREKFLLFTADATRGNPLGNSILRGVFLAWKQLCMLKDTELLAISKDSAGLPVIRIPAKYMAEDASAEDKAVYEMCKVILKSLAQGTSEGIVFPTAFDYEVKQDMFSVDLLKSGGVNTSGIDTVIKRTQDEILSTLSVDILKAGNNTGNFVFADGETNVLALAMRHRLNEIANVLNNDLIPQLYKLNSWTSEVLPRFVPSDISPQSLDELGKFLQRTASVGLVSVDRHVLNKVRTKLGIQALPDDEPVDKENLTMASSNGGEGMRTAGEGTAKQPSGRDKSADNANNAS